MAPIAPPAKRRKTQHKGVEEVKFDPTARQDYLSGFRKRKQARVQHAQKVAAEKAREEKIEERKKLREERKQEVEDHVKAVNEAVKKAEIGAFDSDEEQGAGKDVEPSSQSEAADEAMPEDVQQDGAELGHEDQYIDEEKHTSVTVGPMDMNFEDDVQASDLSEKEEESDLAQDGDKKRSKPARQLAKRITKAKPGDKSSSTVKKKKKPKFHYETKSERKLDRVQQTAKKRKAAATRRAGQRG